MCRRGSWRKGERLQSVSTPESGNGCAIKGNISSKGERIFHSPGEAASVLELAIRHNVDRSHISRTLPLALLAPDIVTAIIDGRTEPSLTLSRIKRLRLPASWRDQRQLLGIR